MKRIIFILLSTIFLTADGLPTAIETTIDSIQGKGATLSKTVPKGRSGIVVHSYGNGLFAITHTAVSLGGGKATLGKYRALRHDSLPTVQTPPQGGDRVIFGNLYDNVLLIAPDEQSYTQVTKSMPTRVWIHPDIYAYYLIRNEEERISLKNLRGFALENQVGLVALIARDGIRVLDPISGVYLRKLPLNIQISQAQSPFYARFDQIETNLFSQADKREFPAYYKGVDSIR